FNSSNSFVLWPSSFSTRRIVFVFMLSPRLRVPIIACPRNVTKKKLTVISLNVTILIMKYLIFGVGFVFCFLAILFIWASWGKLKTGTHPQKFVNTIQQEDLMEDELRILSWNIAFGYGEGSEGKGYAF